MSKSYNVPSSANQQASQILFPYVLFKIYKVLSWQFHEAFLLLSPNPPGTFRDLMRYVCELIRFFARADGTPGIYQVLTAFRELKGYSHLPYRSANGLTEIKPTLDDTFSYKCNI